MPTRSTITTTSTSDQSQPGSGVRPGGFVTQLPNRPSRPLPKWVWLLVAVAAVILVIAAVIRVLTPPPIEVPTTTFQSTNLNNTTTNFTNITFSGTTPQFPESLPVAQAQASPITLQAVVDRFITRFKLEPVPQATGMWSGSVYTLTVDPTDQQTILTQTTLNATTQAVNQTTALAIMQDTLETNFPGLPLQPVADSTYYSLNDVHFHEAPLGTATLMTVDFAPHINGYPIYYGNTAPQPFRVVVNGDDELVRLEFYPQFSAFSEVGTKPLIPVADAVKNINLSQASIISAFQEAVTPISWESITSGTLTKVTLEYRQDADNGLIYPFYRFSGIIINDKGVRIEAEIITPAVATQN